MNSEQLQALSERLEGLSGADREVDALVADVFNAWQHGPTGLGGWTRYPARTFTASIDEAVLLVERTMAGKIGPITLLIAGSAQAMLESGDPCGWRVQVVAPTAPLALLRALVAARIEEVGNE